MSPQNSSFDSSSQNYLYSSDHKVGDDLDYVKRYFSNRRFNNLLDIATGAGHFTQVFEADRKVTCDYSFNMLITARTNYHLDLAVQSDSSNLPFRNDCFEIVTCRIAMHHFSHPNLFSQEVHRILTEKGFFVLIDSIVDIEDAYLNVIEYIRDRSHIRSMTVREIINFFHPTFRLEHFNTFYKKHNFEEWAKRLNPSKEQYQKIVEHFKKLPRHIKDELRIEEDDFNIISYTDKKGLFIFRKL
ncbi:MAG: class I SAM-dependent methyltransferase [Deferribacterales bacterium]